MLDHMFLVKLIRMCETHTEEPAELPHTSLAPRPNFYFTRAELDGGRFVGPWSAAMYSATFFDQAAKSILVSLEDPNSVDNACWVEPLRSRVVEGSHVETILAQNHSINFLGEDGMEPSSDGANNVFEVHDGTRTAEEKDSPARASRSSKHSSNHAAGKLPWAYDQKSGRVLQLPVEGTLTIEWVEEELVMQRLTTRASRHSKASCEGSHNPLPSTAGCESNMASTLQSAQKHGSRAGADRLVLDSPSNSRLQTPASLTRQSLAIRGGESTCQSSDPGLSGLGFLWPTPRSPSGSHQERAATCSSSRDGHGHGHGHGPRSLSALRSQVCSAGSHTSKASHASSRTLQHVFGVPLSLGQRKGRGLWTVGGIGKARPIDMADESAIPLNRSACHTSLFLRDSPTCLFVFFKNCNFVFYLREENSMHIFVYV
jgi:hypothetical protein